MKRISLLLFSSALLLSSCHTLTQTARTAEVGSSLQNATVVDIVPATDHRITHTLKPSQALQRGGMNNIKQAVEAEALVKYGNADVLLEPQYVIEKQQGLLRSKVTSITVSGRPAYYTNFRALHDSVWCNPVFRGVDVYQPRLSSPSLIGKRKAKQGSSKSFSSTAFRPKGFAMYLSPFIGKKEVWGYDNAYYGGYYGGYYGNMYHNNEYLSGGLLLSAGYQFNPYLFAGAGTGMDFYGGIGSIPLYAQARINLSKKANTIFLDGKIGIDLWTFGELFYGLSVGYSFGNFDLAYQYLYHDSYSSYSKSCQQWGLSIGLRF